VVGLSATGRLPHRSAAVAGLASMAGAAALIAVEQVRHRHPRDFVWPQFFDHLHVLGVLAVVLLAAAALEDLVERRAQAA